MAPSTIEETMTVTAEAPLLKVDTSSLGGNIDPKQVSEMPVQGRDWGALLLLAPGSRTTSDNPNRINSRNTDRIREFQANVDGQQFQNTMGGGGQPTFSQEMIAEFQFISNRFDATQGRSSGLQVNLVTKSGTNRFAGSFRSNFRDDRFNAADPVLERVTPFENQQYAGTFGGPILRDRLHFFVYDEYEREPKEETWRTPYPRFNVSLQGTSRKKIGGTRLDFQLSSQTRLMARLNVSKTATPFGPGNTAHPAATSRGWENADQLGLQLTNVLSNRTLNELMVGHAGFLFGEENLTHWSNHWLAQGSPFGPITTGSPRITFTNFTIGGNAGAPRYRVQDLYQMRDTFTTVVRRARPPRHEDRRRAVPPPALHQQLHAVHGDHRRARRRGAGQYREPACPTRGTPTPGTSRRFHRWCGATRSASSRAAAIRSASPATRAWLQDDWHATSRLTLNLGVRYDLLWNMFQNQEEFLPFMEAGRPQNTTNIQPRLGFAYQWNDRTVVRGGAGKYYGEMVQTTYPSEATHGGGGRGVERRQARLRGQPVQRPGAHLRAGAGGLLRRAGAGGQLRRLEGPWLYRQRAVPAARQRRAEGAAAVQHQQQLADVDRRPAAGRAPSRRWRSDYIFTKSRDEGWQQQNVNIAFNPATGINYPFSNRALLPYPEFGVVAMTVQNGRSSYHALQTSFTKRMSNRWQAAATYTLGGLWDALGKPYQGVPGTHAGARRVRPGAGSRRRVGPVVDRPAPPGRPERDLGSRRAASR